MTEETIEQRLKRVWKAGKPSWAVLERMRSGEHWFISDTPLIPFNSSAEVVETMVMEICQFKLTYAGKGNYQLSGCMRDSNNWHVMSYNY